MAIMVPPELEYMARKVEERGVNTGPHQKYPNMLKIPTTMAEVQQWMISGHLSCLLGRAARLKALREIFRLSLRKTTVIYDLLHSHNDLKSQAVSACPYGSNQRRVVRRGKIMYERSGKALLTWIFRGSKQ